MKIDLSIKKFVLFDFDGVIADSLKTALRVHQELLPGLGMEKYLKALEGNVNDWDWKEDLPPGAESEDINFADHYIPRMRKEVEMFDGMDRIVKKLSGSYNLIIISSSLTEPIIEFLNKNRIRDCFLKVMGNDVHHSKVEKIGMVFNEYNTGPNNCIFITDTLGDLKEASQMKVGTLGVAWGFHPKERLARGSFFRIVDRPEEIPIAISDYFALDFVK